jgi:rRNA maturation endonuclease Nob1
MKCSRCQHENLADSKFCSACGAALGLRCPGCNHVVDPQNRFCSVCGHPLGDKAVPEPAGEAALWGGSIAAVGMTANPFGAHQAGPP